MNSIPRSSIDHYVVDLESERYSTNSPCSSKKTYTEKHHEYFTGGLPCHYETSLNICKGQGEYSTLSQIHGDDCGKLLASGATLYPRHKDLQATALNNTMENVNPTKDDELFKLGEDYSDVRHYTNVKNDQQGAVTEGNNHEHAGEVDSPGVFLHPMCPGSDLQESFLVHSPKHDAEHFPSKFTESAVCPQNPTLNSAELKHGSYVGETYDMLRKKIRLLEAENSNLRGMMQEQYEGRQKNS